MAELGMDIMNGQMGHLDALESVQVDMRTLVVARRGNALKVMCICRLMAAELTAELAMARHRGHRSKPCLNHQ